MHPGPKGPRESAWDDYVRRAPDHIDRKALEHFRTTFYSGYTSAFRDLIFAYSRGETEDILRAMHSEIIGFELPSATSNTPQDQEQRSPQGHE